MSNFYSGAWKQPTYLVTTLTPLLLNESLGSADPHGPGQHSNRTFLDLVGAGLFDGTKTRLVGMTGVSLANAANTGVGANLRAPKGVVSLDSAQIYVLEPAGVVAAGDAQLGLRLEGWNDEDDATVGSLNPDDTIVVATAIPAEQANAIVRKISPAPIVSTYVAGDEWLKVIARRSANVAGDTFEDDLHFLGVLLNWTLDE